MKWGSGLFVIILVVLIVVVVSIGETYTPDVASEEVNPYSSTEQGATGSLAFYLLLEEFTRANRVVTPLNNLGSGTLIMVRPVYPLSVEEMGYVSAWMNEGNRVVVLSDDAEIVQQFGANVSGGERHTVTIPPARKHWSTQHVEEIKVQYYRFFVSFEGDVLFADRDGEHPIVIVQKKGKGELFLISAPSMVQNIIIGEGDNEIFLVQACLADTVYFDEYHYYEVKEREPFLKKVRILFTGYSSFFIQAMIALALFMVAYGKRFGVARPAAPSEVQSSELVVSAADLYYRAKKKEVLEILQKKEGEKNEKKKREKRKNEEK